MNLPVANTIDEILPRSNFRLKVSVSARRIGLGILAIFYLLVLFGGFLAPYNYRTQSRKTPFLPPARLHFFDEQGTLRLRPFIYAPKLVDPLTFRYEENKAERFPLKFFVRGERHELFGLIPSTLHLFGVETKVHAETQSQPRIHLLGTDSLGRDLLARTLQGGLSSLLIGPVGLALAFLIGISLGAVSGWKGGLTDSLLMRTTDVVMSLPLLMLILALRAAFPLSITSTQVALMMLLIFASVGWADIARLTRNLVMAEKQRDYVAAAIASGASQLRIISRHILPNISAPLLVQFALSAPTFILAEIALSYLGVGVQEPNASWGTLLAEATELSVLKNYVWMLVPVLFVFFTALAFHLLAEKKEAN
jgi:peptide/nickel transport system permease protein